MRKKTWALGVALVLALGACGQTLGEQALYGGAAGALGGAAVGGDPLVGAAVSAAGNIAYCQMYPHMCN